MTKNDLARLYVKNGYTASISDGCNQIDNFVSIVRETLQNGEKITLHGFLSMQVVKTPQRNFKDPKTGEEKVLKAKKRIKISQTPDFRNLAND